MSPIILAIILAVLAFILGLCACVSVYRHMRQLENEEAQYTKRQTEFFNNGNWQG